MQSLQFYLSSSIKHTPPMNNVVKRNLLTEMTAAFKEWADEYFHEDLGRLNTLISKKQVVEDAISQQKNNRLTSNIITRRLKAWCKYYGYILDPKEMAGKDGRIIKTIEGKSRACHYIVTQPIKVTENVKPNDNEPQLELEL